MSFDLRALTKEQYLELRRQVRRITSINSREMHLRRKCFKKINTDKKVILAGLITRKTISRAFTFEISDDDSSVTNRTEQPAVGFGIWDFSGEFHTIGTVDSAIFQRSLSFKEGEIICMIGRVVRSNSAEGYFVSPHWIGSDSELRNRLSLYVRVARLTKPK